MLSNEIIPENYFERDVYNINSLYMSDFFIPRNILFFIYVVLMLAAISIHIAWLASVDINDEMLDLVIIILISILFLLSLSWLKLHDNRLLVIPAAIILLLYMVAGTKTQNNQDPNMKNLKNWGLGLGGVTCVFAITAIGVGPYIQTT